MEKSRCRREINVPGHVRFAAEGRSRLYKSVREESHPAPQCPASPVVAARITLFGLLQKSETVVIGAMLILPLVSPVLAAALAFIRGDSLRERKATLLWGWACRVRFCSPGPSP